MQGVVMNNRDPKQQLAECGVIITGTRATECIPRMKFNISHHALACVALPKRTFGVADAPFLRILVRKPPMSP